MYKIIVFIPTPDLEMVKKAMFDAGAGRIGNYDSCCFELPGRGQFRPLPGSNPHIGSQDKIEYVEETRVEMVCEDALVPNVIIKMKKAHPYETPAFDVIKLANEAFDS